MTKKEFLKQLADNTEFSALSLEKREKLLTSVWTAIIDLLSKGDEINFTGFGRFLTKVRPARTGRNPATGKPMEIPEKVVAVFKPASKFAEAVNQSETIAEE